MAFESPLSYNFIDSGQTYISDGSSRFILNITIANSSDYLSVLVNGTFTKAVVDPDNLFSKLSFWTWDFCLFIGQ